MTELSESCSPNTNERETPKQSLNIEREIVYPNLKGFKIGHLNIASLPKHIEELRMLMKEMPFDIICINETRLNNSIDNNVVKIPGYDILRRDRNRHGDIDIQFQISY